MGKENALNTGMVAAVTEKAKKTGFIQKEAMKKKTRVKKETAEHKSLALHIAEYSEGHEIELITGGW